MTGSNRLLLRWERLKSSITKRLPPNRRKLIVHLSNLTKIALLLFTLNMIGCGHNKPIPVAVTQPPIAEPPPQLMTPPETTNFLDFFTRLKSKRSD
jgi:hypothetical protein